jgi:Gpi18-like mannosyltransferase
MKLKVILLLGLFVRLLLAPFFAHPFDMYGWYETGEKFLSGAWPTEVFLVPYRYSYFLFVFPATFVFNELTSVVGNSTIPITSINSSLNPGNIWGITLVPGMLYDVLVKLTLIASDVVVAVLLYKLSLMQFSDERLATKISAMWFLNPLVIWVSAGWGMFDTLPVLFSVLSLYLMLRKKFLTSGISLAASILMKYYAAVLIVPFFTLLWRKYGYKMAVRTIITTVVVVFIASLQTAGATIFAFLSLILGSSLASKFVNGSHIFQNYDQSFGVVIYGNQSVGLHYSGINFWSLFTLFSSVNVGLFSFLLLIMSISLVYYAQLSSRRSIDLVEAARDIILPILMLLIFYRTVNPNFIIWIIPFAAILAAKSRPLYRLLWILSFIGIVASVSVSLLPYYLLPVAPWIGSYLAMALSLASPYRVAPTGALIVGYTVGKLYLAGLSLSTFVVLLVTCWKSGLVDQFMKTDEKIQIESTILE